MDGPTAYLSEMLAAIRSTISTSAGRSRPKLGERYLERDRRRERSCMRERERKSERERERERNRERGELQGVRR